MITSPEEFYEVDVTFSAPRIDPARWRLRVDGAVDAPLNLTLAGLLALGTSEIDALLVCVHNPVGGHRMGNGRWTAVSLAAVLDKAGLPDDLASHPAGGELVARSIDGFTVTMSLGEALDRALVAVGLGGRPLPFGNGFPVRLLVPGRYGYAGSVKWLTGLEIRRFPTRDGSRAPGYWTTRGWAADSGRVGASSRIDVPRSGARLPVGPATVAGYAWAPPGGVRSVEVSVDRGMWQQARLAHELSLLSWRAWTFDWEATPGAHVLRVRCSGVEADQEEQGAAPYPNGPTGLHSVAVRVGSTGRAGRLVGVLAGARQAAASRLRLAVDSGRAWR
ncbi:MAG: molybdopterin-dependent oxidoreductase [Blastococcus sp.]|nr:molybdopterin-dependent oxidoreductase [Blastococcus sp.]